MASGGSPVERFANESLSLEERLKAAQEWKANGSDTGNALEPAAWLQATIGACTGVLRSLNPKFEDDEQHKLRHAVLDILSKIPQSEVLKPHISPVFEACLVVIKTDNQENALVACKIVFDLIKIYKTLMEKEAGDFLEVVKQLFKEAPGVARGYLDSATLGDAAPVPSVPVATPATRSVRLLQELPLPCILILQMFTKHLPTYMESLVEVMYEYVRVGGPAPPALPAVLQPVAQDIRLGQVKAMQFVAHLVRQKQGTLAAHLTGLPEMLLQLLKVLPDVVPARKEMLVVIRTLIASPVKEALRPHLEALLDENALLGPPGSQSRTGPGSEALRTTAYQILAEIIHANRKALTASQLGLCVHRLAAAVSYPSQLPAMHMHNMCLRVLNSLVESFMPLAKNTALDGPTKVHVRTLLTRMLEVQVAATKRLQSRVHTLLAEVKAERIQMEAQRKDLISNSGRPRADPAAGAAAGSKPQEAGAGDVKPEPVVAAAGDGDGEGGAVAGTPLLLSLVQTPGPKERELSDTKQLFAIALSAIKPMLYIASNFAKTHQQAIAQAAGGPGAVPLASLPPLPAGLPQGLTEEELRLLSRFWLHCLRCLPLSWHDGDPKEACAKFVDNFSALEPRDFVEVMYPRLSSFFSALLEDPELMLVVTHLGGGQQGGAPITPLGRVFVIHLLEQQLSQRLELLERMQTREGMAALKLNKVLLAALPNMIDLETTYAPMLARAVEQCTSLARAARDPTGYLQMLRSIFKAVLQPRKPLELQRELQPHLHTCLDLFNAMLEGPNAGDLKPLLVELCLTLPVVLDHIPMYVPRLVRPLLIALTQPIEELQLLGLRSFDVWIESCPLASLEAACSQVMPELMVALWALLRPAHSLAQRTMLILGKLGGLNRRWLQEPLKLDYKPNPEYGLRLILTFRPAMSFLTPLDKCMALAKASMLSPQPLGDGVNDLHYRQQALRFLQVSLASVMTLRSCEGDTAGPAPAAAPEPGQADASAAEPKLEVKQGEAGTGDKPSAGDMLLEVLLGGGPVPSVPTTPPKTEQGVKTKTQLVAERSVLVTLLSGVIAAAAEGKLGETAAPFARDVCRHFAMLFAAGTQPPPPAPAMYRPASNSTNPTAGGAQPIMPQGLRELDIHVFLDALLEVLCNKVAKRARAALDGLGIFLETILMLREAKQSIQAKNPALANQKDEAAPMEVDNGPGTGDAAGLATVESAGGAAGSAAEAGAGSDAATEAGQQESGAQGTASAAGAAAGSGASGGKSGKPAEATTKESHAHQPTGAALALGLPPVLDALTSRLLHCCTDDTWQARLAGAAAIKLLVHQPRLPAVYLQHWAGPTVRALLVVIRRLPEHSVVERQEVEATLQLFMRKVLLGEQPPPYKHKDKDHKDHKEHKDVPAAPGALALVPVAAGPGGADAGALVPMDVDAAAADAAPPAKHLEGFKPPTLDMDYVQAIRDVLVGCVLNPSSPGRMRTSAAAGIELLAQTLGTSPSELASVYMAQDKQRDITTQRLLPLKTLGTAIGSAEALAYCCRLQPPLVSWNPALAQVLDDAMTLLESDENVLIEQLPRIVPLPADAFTKLKVSCMNLICGIMKLEGFRELELKADETAAAAVPGAPGQAPPVSSSPAPTGAAAAPTPADGTAAAPAPAAAADASPAPAGEGTAGAAAPAGAAAAGGGASGGGAAGDAGAPQASTTPDVDKAPRGDPALKRRLTLLLLNALATPNPAIHSAAKSAVQALLEAQAKVSKTTLQHGLRPLLKYLGDHKTLTLPILQGLARLLEMLSEWFNSVSLGAKLLEHLTKWTTPEGPSAGAKPGSAPAWRPGEDAAVAAHMLNLFHLLPRQAVQFLETNVEQTRMGLVVLTMELEERLGNLGLPVPPPRISTSPYRQPLTLFLNKYAPEAAAYFLDSTRICHERYVNRLLHILRGTTLDTSPLLAALCTSADKLLPILAIGCSNPSQGGAPAPTALNEVAAPFNAVHLIAHMTKLVPKWLSGEPQLVAALRARWASPERQARLAVELSLERPQLLESKRLSKALLAYVEHSRHDVTPLLDLFSITQVSTMVSFDFLERYCKSIPTNWTDAQIKQLLETFVAAYVSGSYPQALLERMMQVLVNPLVSTCLEAGRQGILDMVLVESIACQMLGLTSSLIPASSQPSTASSSGSREPTEQAASLPDSTAGLPEVLQVELLKLVTSLLAHTPHLFSGPHTKQLITWAWRHLKRDSPAIVSHALLGTAHLFTRNVSPEHVVHQVFTTMLRVYPPGQDLKRPLVRQALDLLLPLLLAKRFAPSPPETTGGGAVGSQPRWVRLLKRLMEDALPGGGAGQLWQQLLKQAHTLHPYRAMFVQGMMSTAFKLAVAQGNGASDMRRLGLDLIALLITWEEKAVETGAAGGGGGTEGRAAGQEGSGITGVKRGREDGSESSPTDPASKTLKTEDGAAAPAAAAPAPGAALPSPATTAAAPAAGGDGDKDTAMTGPGASSPAAAEWRFSPQLQEQLCGLLLRITLSPAGTGAPSEAVSKDEDTALHQTVALSLLARAVRLWPTVNLKTAYLERVLPNSMASAAQAAPPAVPGQMGHSCVPVPNILTVSLSIVKSLLDTKSLHMLKSVHTQVCPLVDACGQTRSSTCAQEAAQIVKALLSWPTTPSDAPPPEPAQAQPQEVTVVLSSLDGLLKRHLMMAGNEAAPAMGAAGPTPMPLTAHPQVLSQLCCCLTVLEEVASLLPVPMMQGILPLLVRVLVKITKEVAGAAQQAAQQAAATRTRTPIIPSSPNGPEYGTLNWALCRCMRLCAPRVLHQPDLKKSVLSSMVNLLVGQQNRNLDTGVVQEFLTVLERWLLRPYPEQQGHLSLKEAILLCQRLGLLAMSEPHNKAGMDVTYLNLLYALCTSQAVSQELRTEAFYKVEKVFMHGLRNSNPVLRRDFLDLYHAAVPVTLFDRLHAIICSHDWENMANTFWLKHALDLLLAVLKEDDDILLAFNSSQVAPLLPGTRQNIYSPMMHNMMNARSGTAPAAAAGADGAAKPDPSIKPEAAAGDGAAPGAPAAVKPDEPAAAAAGAGGDAAAGAAAPAPGAGGDTAGAAPAGDAAAMASAASLAVPLVKMETDGMSGVELGAGDAGNALAASDAGAEAGRGVAPWVPTVNKADVPAEVLELVHRHTDFLRASGALRVKDMMLAAREYLHADTHMAYHLWVLMFPIVWATLEKQQQVQLAKPLINLLSKEWHQRQATLRPNVIQALLDGIAVCQPQPKIPPELIRFLGRTHAAWQIAIPLLESHCVMFPQDTRCFDALGQLYHLISEEDMVCGLWRKRAMSEVTRTALWLLQTGQVDSAEELLGSATRATVTSNLQLPRGEAALWVEQWIQASKTLNQWDALTDYARAVDQTELSVEASWRINDYVWLKDCQNSGRLAAVDEFGPVLLTRCYLAVHEGDWTAADGRVSHASMAAVLKWWQLPDIGTAPQVALLQGFQQIVELRESLRLLSDLQHGGPPRADIPPEMCWQETRDITMMWRNRTPNEWESLVHWQDVLVWRSYVFNLVIKAFSSFADSAPSLHQLGYRDKAWAVNRLGAVATLHGLPDTCLTILNNMYGFGAMEVQEAFVKIREQGKAYLDKPSEPMAGLNLLAITNLDYFNPTHQCELFRLKGALLASIKEVHLAHEAYSIALQLHRNSAEAWVSWANLCDSQWEQSLVSHAPLPAWLENCVHCMVQGVRLGSPTARALLPRLLCQLSFDNDAPGVSQPPPGAPQTASPHPGWSNLVGGAFQRSGGYDLPAWVWLAWLPQLLMALIRSESQVVRPLLQQLAQVAPQALFYPLRVFLLALRDQLSRIHAEMRQRQAALQAAQHAHQSAQAKLVQVQQAAAASLGVADPSTVNPPEGSEAAASLAAARAAVQQAANHVAAGQSSLQSMDAGRQVEATAFEEGRMVNEALRSRWPALSATLEVIVSELGTRFSPRQEERLLAVVHALLHRCYKVSFASQAEVPPIMRKELSGVCKACFNDLNTGGAAGGRARRPGLSAALREQFVSDMNPDSPSFPSTLGTLMDQLKTWRARLLSELEDRMPGLLRLEEESPTLADLELSDVQMPGCYCALLGGGEPPAGLLGPMGGPATPGDPAAVMLECIGSSVAIVRRQGHGHRRLALHGSDGKVQHMLLQQNCAWVSHCADERILQLLRGMNRLLEARPPSRSRHLAWYTPAMLPVHTSMRLMEEDPAFTTYGEAYDISCTRYGREPDMPILHFKKRYATPSGSLVNDPVQSAQLRLLAYTEICEKLVTENVFSQYVYKTLPGCNHLWLFKKTFCTHSALAALLCHLLVLGGRAPPKILFDRDTGKVHQLELNTQYSDKGLLDKQESVPCRLTRNMSTFFTGFGVEGVFLAALVNAAGAILHKAGNVTALLALFFRDDITTWSARRSTKAILSSNLKTEVLRQLVSTNTRKSSERLRSLAPSPCNTDDLLGLLQGTVRCPVAAGAVRLVEAATDAGLLSRMDATWHPWF